METIIPNASAIGTDNHIPFSDKNIGNSRIAPTRKTNVLQKEIIPEILPSEKAVKRAEVKILKLINRNVIEKIGNPFVIISNTLDSFWVNIIKIESRMDVDTV